MRNAFCVKFRTFILMDNDRNPFVVAGYFGAEYFCDRELETSRLKENLLNGLNTTLLSIRRMGKSGLIHHLFNSLERNRNIKCLYVDVLATENQNDFLNKIATAIINSFPPKKNIGKKVMEYILSLRPVISYDTLSGQPEISFSNGLPGQQSKSLESLFNYLDSLELKIFIALDEFQQIGNYPEKNTESLLRTIIQTLKSVNFVFSGSSKHLLSQMFTNHKRPFYSSSQVLELEEIDKKIYSEFIIGKFENASRKIEPASVEFVCLWTKLHTYYTQVLCNRLFAIDEKLITLEVVRKECGIILKEQEVTFFQYRNLITTSQWKLLTAIAKEDKLYKPGASEFLIKYGLGAASGVQRALQALLQKELVYMSDENENSCYRVYDVFLSRWLEAY